MNEIDIQTTIFEPAKIEFNKAKIEQELNETLKKYQNLVFTEDNTKEIRDTLAELRKGKKAADEFRKSRKKEATEQVDEFEKDIKSITKKFDEVIDPINEQLQEFEARRKEEKHTEILKIAEEVIANVGLDEKHASQLDIGDHYLAKSYSMKQIKENLEFRANNLLNEQRLEQANRESIQSFVELENSKNNLNLSVQSYISQLEFKDVEEVKNTVSRDAEMELEK